MALTATKVWFSHDSQMLARTTNEAEVICTLSPGTYATGGDTVTELATWFSVVHGVELITSTISGESVPGLRHVGMDGTAPSTAKLVCYTEDGTSGISAQVADMTNLAAVTLRLKFKGIVASNYSA